MFLANSIKNPEIYDEIISVETTNFEELINISKLNKRTDLIGLDFSNTDISDSDLRNFNFSRCNLSGITGINFIIDDSTIIEDAIIDNSVFSFKENEFKARDGKFEKKYHTINTEYWANKCVWIGENIKKGSDFDNKRISIRLINDTKDKTVISEIFRRMKYIFERKEDYKNFLISIILNDLTDESTICAALTAAIAVDALDDFVFRTYISYLRRASDRAYNEIMRSLILSKNFYKYDNPIRELAFERYSDNISGLYIRRINDIFKYGPNKFMEVSDNMIPNFFSPIDYQTFIKIVHHNSNRDINAAISKITDKRKKEENRKTIKDKITLKYTQEIKDFYFLIQKNHKITLLGFPL
jgi:hypothetical protein